MLKIKEDRYPILTRERLDEAIKHYDKMFLGRTGYEGYRPDHWEVLLEAAREYRKITHDPRKG